MGNVRCDSCGTDYDPADTPGGLLFGVPNRFARTRKYHLCRRCIRKIVRRFR